MRVHGASSSGCGGCSTASNRAQGEDIAIDRKLHQTIAGIAVDIEALSFNKAVAKLFELVNAIERAGPSASRTDSDSHADAAGRANGTASRRRGLGSQWW